MGDGVFGTPITSSNNVGSARLALDAKNADGKDARAFQFVDTLKENSGVAPATLCFIYNATGDTLQLISHKDWYGHIGASPYPIQIANGQWGAFLHVSKNSKTHSVGAVVYRGKNNKGVSCDWMVAWDNPINKETWNTKTYTEVREKGHFAKQEFWDIIYKKMQDFGRVNYCSLEDGDNQPGCSSSVSIGGNFSFPIFSAVLTLEDA
ncbi:hypothetical protein FEM48_Zijuj07G0007600 [Ziziphus jujuba var. spinosa]|uniref:23 kDa jasmonate-induced protein-like n=1 Tax=Ziziphus jujuba var. spinosa TaxID=714518 RepID=A0A978V1G2_ZIZJJ|nr:23 kDa jasmonate-induced protein-like [Ziziphus jujuba var. spinosa]KAH7521195.1 hypothetical protein FEM48_Zijuj07G0007600 [Ziziphus jujuba var. spinosa]